MLDTIHQTQSPAAAISEAKRIAPLLGAPLREAANLTLADVGRAVGVTAQAVWAWERGTHPTGERAVRYVGLLEELDQMGTEL